VHDGCTTAPLSEDCVSLFYALSVVSFESVMGTKFAKVGIEPPVHVFARVPHK